MSGSQCFPSGVGTQMMITSASPSRLKSVVPSKRFESRSVVTSSSPRWTR